MKRGEIMLVERASLRYPLAMAVSERVRRLAEDYAELSAEERQEFATLVAPLEEDTLSAEWREEIRRRAAEIDAGKVTLIDGEDFLRRLRAV